MRTVALIAIAAVITQAALAQYPEKTVTILVGYGVGSPGDFQAIVAPPGTPAPIVQALAEGIRKAMNEPSFIALVEKTGNTSEYRGPEVFAADLRAMYGKNGELVRALGLSVP